VVSFLHVAPPTHYMHFSSPPFKLHDPPLSLFLKWSLELYLWLAQIIKTLITKLSPAGAISTRTGPNTRRTSLLSNTLSLCLPLNVTQFHTHIKKQTKLLLHIVQSLLFCTVDGVTKILDQTLLTFPKSNLPLTSSWIQYSFLRVVPKCKPRY
jgi:hypothetical protein